MAHIGERIKFFIEKMGIKPREIWQGAEISKSTLYLYISGENDPDWKFVLFLTQKYKLRAYWLLTGEGEMEWGGVDPEVNFLFSVIKDERAKEALCSLAHWIEKK